MDQTSGRNTFGFLSATAAITIVAMILFGLAWWLVKSAFGQVAGSEQAIILAAIVAWGSSLLGLLPVAMVSQQGLMPTVYGYFVGAAIRVIICIVASVIAIASVKTPAGPWATTLLGMYLPLLFLEVSLIAQYIWRIDGPRRGSTDSGSSPDDDRMQVHMETLA